VRDYAEAYERYWSQELPAQATPRQESWGAFRMEAMRVDATRVRDALDELSLICRSALGQVPEEIRAEIGGTKPDELLQREMGDTWKSRKQATDMLEEWKKKLLVNEDAASAARELLRLADSGEAPAL